MNIETISGLYMGEGHFSITRLKNKNDKFQFKAEVGFSNSDPALIDYVCSWLDSHGAHHYIRQSSNNCYQLVVQHYADILKVVVLLEPHIFGNKKAEMSLLKRFVLHRLRPKELPIIKLGNNQHNPYTDEDHHIVDEKRILRESSETKSIPVCCSKHGNKGSTFEKYRDVKFNSDTHKYHAVR